MLALCRRPYGVVQLIRSSTLQDGTEGQGQAHWGESHDAVLRSRPNDVVQLIRSSKLQDGTGVKGQENRGEGPQGAFALLYLYNTILLFKSDLARHTMIQAERINGDGCMRIIVAP